MQESTISSEEFLLSPDNSQFLEDLIAVAGIKDNDFFSKFGEVICGSWKDGFATRPCNDFTNKNLGNIWHVIRAYRNVYGYESSVSFMSAFPQLAMSVAASGKASILETDIPTMKNELCRLLVSPASAQLASFKHSIASITRSWVFNRRYKMFASYVQLGSMTPDMMDNQVRDLKELLSFTEDVQYIFDFGEDYTEETEVEAIDTPWPSVTGMLGGGWTLGDATLWVAPPGGGKTVIAMQCAAHAANMGYNTLSIFSEQKRWHMNSRAIAAVCGVEFTGAEFTEGKIKWEHMGGRVQEVRDRIRKHFKYMDYVLGGRSILKNLETDVALAQKMFNGELKMVTVDWIGALLGGDSKPEELRHTMKAAMALIANLAKVHNVHIHAFAQISELQSKGKKYIMPDMISECKQLHEKATNGFGVSGLKISESAAGGEGVFVDRQYFTAFKTRKNFAKCLPMDRDFGYQRFADVTAGQRITKNSALNQATAL